MNSIKKLFGKVVRYSLYLAACFFFTAVLLVMAFLSPYNTLNVIGGGAALEKKRLEALHTGGTDAAN